MNIYDFEEDIKTAVITAAKNMGYKIPQNDSLKNTLINYLTVKSKLISLVPRKVLACPELLIDVELKKHPKSEEIATIMEIARRGGNLNLFQSHRLTQTNFHDLMINEWGIYHFHLSLEREKGKNYFKRTDALLFAYIESDFIIFLGTDKHSEGVFADDKWIRMLHDNFPHVMEKYIIKGACGLSVKFKPKERQKLWNSGISCGSLEIDGKVYFNPGGGIVSTKHHEKNIRNTLALLRWKKRVEQSLNEKYKEISQLYNISFEEAEFKVMLEKDFILKDITSGITLLTFPQIWNL